MRDEEKLEAFIQEMVDDTLSGLEDLLPPEAMACVRGRLEDDFHAHPVMSLLVKELAPVEVPQVRTDEGVHPDIAAEAEGKKHG
jgi:hypothetical protein